MPSKSKAQHNFMAMIAHNPKAAKRAGVPQSVGRDFVAADKGKKFAAGGSPHSQESGMEKAMEKRHAQTLRKIASEEAAEANKMKCGGKVKKYARGGGIEVRGKTKGKMV